jgi:hypothetical protein
MSIEGAALPLEGVQVLELGNYIAYIAAPPRCPVARRPGSRWSAR